MDLKTYIRLSRTKGKKRARLHFHIWLGAFRLTRLPGDETPAKRWASLLKGEKDDLVVLSSLNEDQYLQCVDALKANLGLVDESDLLPSPDDRFLLDNRYLTPKEWLEDNLSNQKFHIAGEINVLVKTLLELEKWFKTNGIPIPERKNLKILKRSLTVFDFPELAKRISQPEPAGTSNESLDPRERMERALDYGANEYIKRHKLKRGFKGTINRDRTIANDAARNIFHDLEGKKLQEIIETLRNRIPTRARKILRLR